MVNLVSGPIVAVMGTAEGVIVKAKELIESVLGRDDIGEEDDFWEGDEETEAEPAPDRRNGQAQPQV
ncbi:MAG: hypothetical protein JOZ49_18170 [Mycolicibacterium sp.]|nr:hypothetical protein [Mycolicibacterium sp.]